MMRFLTVRMAAGFVEGVVLIALSSRQGWNNFNAYALIGAAILSVAISAATESKHFASWSERGDTAGAASFVLVTGLVGAPVVALAAYVTFFSVITRFMAP